MTTAYSLSLIENQSTMKTFVVLFVLGMLLMSFEASPSENRYPMVKDNDAECGLWMQPCSIVEDNCCADKGLGCIARKCHFV